MDNIYPFISYPRIQHPIKTWIQHPIKTPAPEQPVKKNAPIILDILAHTSAGQTRASARRHTAPLGFNATVLFPSVAVPEKAHFQSWLVYPGSHWHLYFPLDVGMSPTFVCVKSLLQWMKREWSRNIQNNMTKDPKENWKKGIAWRAIALEIGPSTQTINLNGKWTI